MQGRRKTKLGRVISTRMNKTAVVAVETFRHHPIYKKPVRRVARYKAHDEKNECGLGDTVRLEETRPLSREKRWRVAEIVTKAEVVEVKPRELETEMEDMEAESREPEAAREETGPDVNETEETGAEEPRDDLT